MLKINKILTQRKQYVLLQYVFLNHLYKNIPCMSILDY